jgi:hypothetical protein
MGDNGKAMPPTRAQVVMSFVIGLAAFGFGLVACGSYLFGILHVPAWLAVVGAFSMMLGTGVILGGGLGGMEARAKDKASGGNTS